MKDAAQPSKTVSEMPTPATIALQKKVASAEKNVQKSWEECEKKAAAYDAANKPSAEKTVLVELKISAKVAKLNYKIKRAELKLAKALLKFSTKSDKKSSQKAAKSAEKALSKKAPKDLAAKGKGSPSVGARATAAKTGKKAAA
jgi:predicted HAD superfamily hydrolase